MENFIIEKGKHGSGKTTLLLTQAIFSIRNNKKVLIINNEEHLKALERRLTAMQKGNGISGIHVLQYLDFEKDNLNEIVDGFDVILIDNLELFSDNKSMSDMLNIIRCVADCYKNKKFVITMGARLI